MMTSNPLVAVLFVCVQFPIHITPLCHPPQVGLDPLRFDSHLCNSTNVISIYSILIKLTTADQCMLYTRQVYDSVQNISLVEAEMPVLYVVSIRVVCKILCMHN